ncbi:SprT-like domain-containing protein [Halobacteriales archaeon Cl-PHB]
MSERTGSTPAGRQRSSGADDGIPADQVPGWPTTRADLLDRAADYAASVDVDVDVAAIDWEISERAKRRAGGCRYDAETGQVTILLTWDAYRAHGWDEFTGTIRHELVHAWELERFGECGHGERFRRKAREIDAPRFCQAFSDGRLRLVCTDGDCEWAVERHRASKTVKYPGEGYVCGRCGSDYLVRHVATGREWQHNEGYRRARQAIGGDW